jgi:hypothetical protein
MAGAAVRAAGRPRKTIELGQAGRLESPVEPRQNAGPVPDGGNERMPAPGKSESPFSGSQGHRDFKPRHSATVLSRQCRQQLLDGVDAKHVPRRAAGAQ